MSYDNPNCLLSTTCLQPDLKLLAIYQNVNDVIMKQLSRSKNIDIGKDFELEEIMATEVFS